MERNSFDCFLDFNYWLTTLNNKFIKPRLSKLTSRFWIYTGSSTCNILFEGPQHIWLLAPWPQIVPTGLHGTPQQSLPFWSHEWRTPLFPFLQCVSPVNNWRPQHSSFSESVSEFHWCLLKQKKLFKVTPCSFSILKTNKKQIWKLFCCIILKHRNI